MAPRKAHAQLAAIRATAAIDGCLVPKQATSDEDAKLPAPRKQRVSPESQRPASSSFMPSAPPLHELEDTVKENKTNNNGSSVAILAQEEFYSKATAWSSPPLRCSSLHEQTWHLSSHVPQSMHFTDATFLSAQTEGYSTMTKKLGVYHGE